MKLFAIAFLLAGVLCAQAPHPATTGYGSVLYPGLGGPPPPSAHGGFGSVVFPGTGGPPGTRLPVSRPGGTRIAPPPVAHPSHSRAVIVPVPVYYGGYYYGADANNGYVQPAPAYDALAPSDGSGQPVVILNQGYLPNPGMQYAPPPSIPQDFEAQAQEQPPTIYLLAMKDHTIIPSIAYWVDGDTINYITTEGSQNRVSLSLIDRDFSKQLNDSRNVEFKLPPAN